MNNNGENIHLIMMKELKIKEIKNNKIDFANNNNDNNSKPTTQNQTNTV
jgi:hypothetical protein